LLAVCLFLAGTGAPVLAADEARPPEATLHYHFRPIVTFRTTFVGVTPEYPRAAGAEPDRCPASRRDGKGDRANAVHVDGRRGINLHIGESALFNILEGDLDPEEKLSLEEVARRTADELGAALQAASAQRRPMVLLKGCRTLAAGDRDRAGPSLADSSGNRMDGRSLSAGDRSPSRVERLPLGAYAWLLVQRVAQLLMGFLWLSVAYLWLTFVLARFPLTEPLGDRLTDFLFGLLDTLGTGIVGAIPALTTAVVILFLTKAFNDAIGNFFKAPAKAGGYRCPACIRRR
jgi:hypothetical protein